MFKLSVTLALAAFVAPLAYSQSTIPVGGHCSGIAGPLPTPCELPPFAFLEVFVAPSGPTDPCARRCRPALVNFFLKADSAPDLLAQVLILVSPALPAATSALTILFVRPAAEWMNLFLDERKTKRYIDARLVDVKTATQSSPFPS
ncbi:hypothetical protein BDZ97DRAFT_1917397 [Flammula alnicola]|nr:hypothetical protein BDZ97DRAFT_1917397 [Flammula alnicola]